MKKPAKRRTILQILRHIDALLEEERRSRKKRENSDRKKFDYIDNAELKKWFNITSKTAHRWVMNGILRCGRVEGRLYYKISDINDMMKEHFQRV